MDPQINEREFSRINVRLRARFRQVDEAEAREVEERIQEAPTIWAVEGEGELAKLAGSPGSGHEGLLARSLLDVSRQIQRMSHRLFDDAGPMDVAELMQLSGGGCRISSQILLQNGALLDMRVLDEEMIAPPIRVLAEVRHTEGSAPARCGLSFRGIHPTDQERLIRYIYLVQRQELRKASMQES